MLKNISILLKFVLVLFVGFLLLVTTFTVNFEWPSGIAYTDRFIYLNRYFVDFFQIAALLVLLNSGPKLLRVLGLVLSVMFVAAYFIQSQSFATIGKYLPSIALENSDHIDFLQLDNIAFTAGVWIIFFFLLYRLISRFLVRTSISSSIVVAFLLIVLTVLSKNDDIWLSESIVAGRFDFYNSGRAGVLPKSPLGELLKSYNEYRQYLKKQNFIAGQVAVQSMSEKTAEFVYKNYNFFAAENPEYPMVRESKFDATPSIIKELNLNSGNKKNIIIIFAEGMSTKLVQPYSNFFHGLTPNIEKFSEEAIKVDKYNSHTFATYRGLGGQLCSSFPVGRLFKQTDYYCLGHALKDNGYDTSFMVSQFLEKTDLDLVLMQAGFDHVIGAKSIVKSLELEEIPNAKTVPDSALFDALIQRLESQEIDQNKPFALGLYNFETHTGVRLHKTPNSYIGTPENPLESSYLLDRFHNFDRVFGKFWDYFKNSKFYDNTIVILTTDHATFPSKNYQKLLNGYPGRYTPIFVDEIPLMIYHPDLAKATSIDADSATSLDFAPSVLHLAGIKKTHAPFLGSSLFNVGQNRPYAKIAGGPSRMLYQSGKLDDWYTLNDGNADKLPKSEEIQASRREFLKYLQSLEQANKLWLRESSFK